MFGPSKRSKNGKAATTHRPWATRLLKVEGLESRHMLSGVVTVAVAAGNLTLSGDASSNSIQLRADPVIPTNFIVTGLTGTQLQVAGNPVVSPFTAVGVTGNVSVSLANGNDSFDFQGPSGGGVSNVLGTLVVVNGNGADTTTLNNVAVAGAGGATIVNAGQATNNLSNFSTTGGGLVITTGAGAATTTLSQIAVNGSLVVAEGAGGAGDRALTLNNSTIQGTTTIVTSGGNSTTAISNSALQASTGGTALTVATTAGAGAQATLSVFDSSGPSSTFGAGSFVPPPPFGPPPPPLGPAVVISNGGAGAGGTTTQFIGQSPGNPVVVYGAVVVLNAPNASPVALDITSFASTIVLGAVTVSNAGTSATQTLVTNSKLGTQLLQGGPLIVTNVTGADLFSMSGTSSVPWGALINNNAGGAASAFGSTTTVGAGAQIGTRPAGPAIPAQAGVALAVSGDTGVDTVTVTGATFGGGINLGTTFGQIGLDGGNNVVAISGTTINNGGLDMTLGPAVTGNNSITLTNSIMAALNVTLGTGSDHMKIVGGTISAALNVNMGPGVDLVELRDGTTAPTPPDPLLVVNTLNGGGGIDTLLTDADVDASIWGATGFELFA